MIFLLLQGVYFQLFVCKVIRLYNLPLQLTEQNKRTECLRKSITYRPCSRRGNLRCRKAGLLTRFLRCAFPV